MYAGSLLKVPGPRCSPPPKARYSIRARQGRSPTTMKPAAEFGRTGLASRNRHPLGNQGGENGFRYSPSRCLARCQMTGG